MSAIRLDGREIAAQMREEMGREVTHIAQEHMLRPGLAVVLVGENPASQSYVRSKTQACQELGMHSVQLDFPASLSTEALLETIADLNADDSIHGVSPEKDVDGLHPVNLGRLLRGEEGFWPCTPHGVLQILQRSGVEVAGKHAVVVGRSPLVGRPVANLLAQKMEGGNATVTLCHTGTHDLGYFTRQADILVVAAGQPRAITDEMVKEGAVVIDVGVNRIEDATRERGWRLVGDVDYAAVRKKARAITPVPNGVGPMTITMLLYNTIDAAKRLGGVQ